MLAEGTAFVKINGRWGLKLFRHGEMCVEGKDKKEKDGEECAARHCGRLDFPPIGLCVRGGNHCKVKSVREIKYFVNLHYLF